MSKKITQSSLQSLAATFCSTRTERDFTKLYDRIRPGVFVFLHKYLPNADDVEDAISLTFAKAWSKIEQYDPYYQFSTWIYGIARNEALQIIRGRKDKIEVSYDALSESNSGLEKFIETCEIVDPSDYNKIDILYEVAVSTIEKLPETYHLALWKREMEGKKEKEVAEELGWNLMTTKTRIRKGRQIIKNHLLKNYADLCHTK